MQLTHSQVARLAELNVQLFTCKQQITELKKMMHQLLQPQEHKISVNITITNTSYPESEMPLMNFMEERLMNALGVPNKRFSQSTKQQSVCYNPEASTGIRILNAILQERQEIQKDILTEMESLVSVLNNIDIENPIHSRHSS